jgi:hypothetical protein
MTPYCTHDARFVCCVFEVAPSGKPASRLVVSVGSGGSSYLAMMTASFSVPDTDLPAFVGLRFYQGNVALGDTIKTFFQVERLTDYTPANRQVVPTPVPTDYTNQLAILNNSTASLTSRVTVLESPPVTYSIGQLGTAYQNGWTQFNSASTYPVGFALKAGLAARRRRETQLCTDTASFGMVDVGLH